jgi:hypothetical protein
MVEDLVRFKSFHRLLTGEDLFLSVCETLKGTEKGNTKSATI